MNHLEVVNRLVRLRIDATSSPAVHERIGELGTIEHISQRRVFYVDVEARNPDEALATARQALTPQVAPENVRVTTPNAPLDQPGSLPI